MANDLIVSKLEPAVRALAECRDAQAAKRVADIARAAEIYARRQKLGDEAINYATAIKVDAMTLMGEFLKAAPKNNGAAGRGEKGAKRGSLVEPPIDQPPTLAEVGIGRKESVTVQALAELKAKDPETHEKVRTGKKTVRSAVKELKAAAWQEEEEKAIAEAPALPDGCRLEAARMEDFLPTLSGVDLILTDPPYPEEFLPLYGELARLAKAALKPNGVLAVLCGQYHLPHIFGLMAPHLPYRWTMAYLTPGGQSVQIWSQKVNTFWKPVLLFGGMENWVADTTRSEVNHNDKRFHEWGQSFSGMASLVRALSKPRELICDPFLGAGTTAAAALSLGRRFVGCDVDSARVTTALERLQKGISDVECANSPE